MPKLFLVVFWLMLPGIVVSGQNLPTPRFEFHACDVTASLPFSMRHVTNYNPSVDLGDSVLTFIYDSLRFDGEATIVTVYETDADSVVGLWEMGSGPNRTLWLNSRRVSYGDISIPYRSDNERGVIVHTMCYRHPVADSAYSGKDTLYLGREGLHDGEKRLCALYYFPGKMPAAAQRSLESALAVRYGAWLHSPYVDSRLDTLWDPAGADSAYSSGVCGIGRDDSLSLFQCRSVTRGDILTLAADTLDDRSYVMLGHDSGGLWPAADTVVDSGRCSLLERRWKLRAHGFGQSVDVRFSVSLPFLSGNTRLMLSGGGDTLLLASSSSDSLLFGPVALADGIDYRLSLLAGSATFFPSIEDYGNDAAGTPAEWKNQDGSDLSDDVCVAVTPNPTAGGYTVSVDRPDGGEVAIRVVDTHGRTVSRHSMASDGTPFQYSGWLRERGVYYIHVTCNGRSLTTRLLVMP